MSLFAIDPIDGSFSISNLSDMAYGREVEPKDVCTPNFLQPKLDSDLVNHFAL